jgi:hypothetical protein
MNDRPKKHYAIYYFGAPVAAKARAAELRREKQSAIVIDAYAFNGELESCDLIEFIGNEKDDDAQKARIVAAYSGRAKEANPVEEEAEAEKIFVPEGWQKLSWTKLQSLASEIKPDATIRNKDEAKSIIADYLEDNS